MSEAAKPTHGDRMDRSWKRYRNPDLGYCVSYPSRWFRGSAFDGSGLFVETGHHRDSKPTGEIDVGPLNVEINEDARLKPTDLTDSLDQDLREHLEGLQKFARAEKLETIDQHNLNVQGFKALYSKNQYYDPLERTNWLEEVIFVRRTNGELYRLELQCQPDQLKRFEPVFAYVVNTFEFNCK